MISLVLPARAGQLLANKARVSDTPSTMVSFVIKDLNH